MSHARSGKKDEQTGLLTRGLQWLFVLLLILILIPSGSVNFVSLHFMATAFFVVATLASVTGRNSKATVRLPYWLGLGVALILAAWIVAQSLAVPSGDFASSAWTDATRLHGPMKSALSVAPGDTLQGLTTALLPFGVFLTVLLLFSGDRQAYGLIVAIVAPGTLIVLIGIIQHVFYPHMLLFESKQFYLDSLTAVFVNRNTAATYIAMIAIFAVGLAFHFGQNSGFGSLGRFLVGSPSATTRKDALRALAAGTAALLAFIALMMTNSRAGIGAGTIGLSVMLAILAYHGGHKSARYGQRSFSRTSVPTRVKLLRAGSVVMGLFVIGALLAGKALLRAEVQGTGDLRFCYLPSLLRMALDNWLVGTGFGTFRDVFPAYRDPACGMSGTLLQAHNVYLEGIITLGVLFVLLAVIVLSGLFAYLARGVRHRRQYRWVAAAGIGVLVTQILHNGVDFSIQNPGVACVFAALMGACVVISTGRTVRTNRAATSGGTLANFGGDRDDQAIFD